MSMAIEKRTILHKLPIYTGYFAPLFLHNRINYIILYKYI